MIPAKISDTTRRRYTRNIVAAWHAASDDQRARGRAWYPVAHGLAEQMAGDARTGAGLIAALSANKRWDQNLRIAQDAATGRVHGHVGDALRKVEAILAGADPESVLPMDSKTGHFYRCILDPSDPDAVVIDRHAHDIAVGRAYGDDDRGLSAKGRYAALARCYRDAAARLGELPSVVQAVTWVAHVERTR